MTADETAPGIAAALWHEDAEVVLPPPQAAARLQVSERTLRRWLAGVSDGNIVSRPGKPMFYAERQGSRWLLHFVAVQLTQQAPDAGLYTALGELRERLAALERECQTLRQDKAWLQRMLEREQQAHATTAADLRQVRHRLERLPHGAVPASR